jgi:ligand-binding SRPBCC domain-containing protein
MSPLRFESRLAASAPAVWAEVSTMGGVNAELLPLMRMTYPVHAQRLEAADVKPGTVLFQSWLLAFGVLPVDRHALSLERLYPGEGFDERSSSWMQRIWIHRRRITTVDAGSCHVTDEVSFEPRLPFAAPLLRGIVGALFAHRHRRLRRRFGEAAA